MGEGWGEGEYSVISPTYVPLPLIPSHQGRGNSTFYETIKVEKTEKTQSLRKLARLGFEYYVAKAYGDGRVTLRDASVLLKLPLSETIDVFSELGDWGTSTFRILDCGLRICD